MVYILYKKTPCYHLLPTFTLHELDFYWTCLDGIYIQTPKITGYFMNLTGKVAIKEKTTDQVKRKLEKGLMNWKAKSKYGATNGKSVSWWIPFSVCRFLVSFVNCIASYSAGFLLLAFSLTIVMQVKLIHSGALIQNQIYQNG